MTQLGIPVPAGFTITTDACRAYLRTRELPAGLEEEVDEHVRRLEVRTARRFGSSSAPLLVSVRSGAAISMPGMMDTILNLGLGDDAAAGLADETRNPRFAFDSYRRLIQMFGEVVDGIDAHRFESALSALKDARGVREDVALSGDDLRDSSRPTRGSIARNRGASSRRTRTNSSRGRSPPCSRRGTRRAPRCTAAPTTSPTTSAPP